MHQYIQAELARAIHRERITNAAALYARRPSRKHQRRVSDDSARA